MQRHPLFPLAVSREANKLSQVLKGGNAIADFVFNPTTTTGRPIDCFGLPALFRLIDDLIAAGSGRSTCRGYHLIVVEVRHLACVGSLDGVLGPRGIRIVRLLSGLPI